MALPLELPGIPGSWIQRATRTGGGAIFQRSYAARDEDSVRVMPPGADSRYPHGYVRFTNDANQKLRIDGKPGDNADTHIPRRSDGSWPVPRGWKYH